MNGLNAQPRLRPAPFRCCFPPARNCRTRPAGRASAPSLTPTKHPLALPAVVSLTPPHPDNAIPPAQLHDVLGLAGVVVGHLPGGPAQLPTALRCGVSLSASPLIARWPAGPAQLPASQMHSGLASAGVMVVHLGPACPRRLAALGGTYAARHRVAAWPGTERAADCPPWRPDRPFFLSATQRPGGQRHAGAPPVTH